MLSEDAARERLPDVVCVALDDAGEIVGVNAVREAMPRPPARPMWVYQAFLAGDPEDLWTEMFTAAFDALEREFDVARGGPLGVSASRWTPRRRRGGRRRSGRKRT